jgi:two-component system, NtrC family, nitrogen regulation sensor histidine kinase NtrY
MNFKNFRFNILARIVLLTLSLYGFAEFLSESGYGMTVAGLGILIVYQLVRLIALVENTNREVIHFLHSIQYDDFSQTYRLSLEGKTFDELNQAFQNVWLKFKDIRNEKESKYQYLRYIIQHLGVAIITYDRSGEVDFMNNAAKKLFKTNRLPHIQKLDEISHSLVDLLQTMRQSEHRILKIQQGSEAMQLLVNISEFAAEGKEYRLAVIQNVQREMEEQELNAWERIINVLTHEVMNSLTPISSLANTLEMAMEDFKEKLNGNTDEADWDDMYLAVQTIQRRSENLVRFVNDFRTLTQLAPPKFKNLPVQLLFEDIYRLVRLNLKQHSINWIVLTEPETLIITADKSQIEQVLLNLVKNAIDALADLEDRDDKTIWLTARLDERSHPIFSIRDNGAGIDPDAVQRIFVPFFTTKKFGSGIGLSLSRQIMRQHNGSIAVQSSAEGTEFTLQF